MAASLSKRFVRHKRQSPHKEGFVVARSLTMTYFHMGIHTIIGAKSFHCPVRDGKEWCQLAMVVRQTDRHPALFCRLPCLWFFARALTQIGRASCRERV